MQSEGNIYNHLLAYEEIINFTQKHLSEQENNIPKKDEQKKDILPEMQGKASVAEILQFMFPPTKIIVDNEEKHVKISTKEAGDHEIENLAKSLERALEDRQARRNGICDVRAQIYEEAFNELIRQVTINSPERGLLLMKLRDEMKVTVIAYKNLYDCSVTFGVRKQRQAEEGVKDMENKIKFLKRRKQILLNQKMDLDSELSSLKQSYDEIDEHDKKKMKEEVDFLDQQNKMLSAFLEDIKHHDDIVTAKEHFKSQLNQ